MAISVLVTGGSGFIGSHVVDRLVVAGYRARILDARPSPWHPDVDAVLGDIMRLDDVRAAMRGCDAVCHLAAAADVGEVSKRPGWATELNSTGTLNVLEAARELGIKRVVYASTVWVYSDVDVDGDGDEVDEDTPLRHPAHLYTAGKLSGELYCRSYMELFGLQPTVVRFGIPYGPRARPAAVIPSFVDRARRGEPLTVAGTGEQERSFIYVEDLAEGVVCALAPPAAGRTYNLAGTETTTIRELAEVVCEEVAPTEIIHAEGRAADLRGARVSSARAERELGWRATTSLRDGIRRYAAWLEDRGTSAVVERSRQRRPLVSGLLASAARNPTLASVLACLAILSATLTVVVGAGDEDESVDLAVLGAAMLSPVWAFGRVPWTGERRRVQAALAAGLGALGVLLLGLFSASGGDVLHARRLTAVLAVSAAATSGVRLLPRRLARAPG